MKNKLYISIFVFLFSLFGFAQSNYYYYNNKKVYVNIDREYISINSILNNAFLETFNTNYLSKTEFVENNNRSNAQATDSYTLSRKTLKSYYSEIKVITSIKDNLLNYTNFVNSLNNNSNIIKVSPCYKTISGKRLGLTNNFYVKINPSNINSLYSYAQSNNVEILGRDSFMDNWYILSCSKNNPKNSLELANQFHESGLFITAEPEFVYHDLQASVDPLYSEQWGLKNTGQYGSQFTGIDIKAEQAWTITKGNNVKVAVYDHGIEMNHPDLAANIFGTGFDSTTGTSPAQVRGEHGTACAGIVGAVQNNNLGGSGVAPDCDLVSISIELFFSDTPAQLASGFSWAWQNGVEVISNSWGGYAPSNIITDAIYSAINNGRNGKGCVVVFAAGNEDDTNIRYPGSAIPEVLVVGAMSPCGERKSFNTCDGENFWGSCYGNQLDIVAPGVLNPTTDQQGANGYNPAYETNPNYSNQLNYYSSFNGTSSACPHVAGVAALILSVNPCLTAQQVRDIIEQTSQKVGSYSYTSTAGRPNGTWNNEMGYGLVNAFAAVQMAQSMGSATLDLMVKDGTDDIGNEPNNITPYMWASTDIWVRNQPDGIDSHQNPEYSPTVPNYAYVRVTNKSCVASAGNEQLKFYWAKAGTSLEWPASWNGQNYFPSPLPSPLPNIKLGNEVGTGVTIPPLQAGQETILQIPFMVPNPADYSFAGSDQWHFCLLARIEAINDPSNETNGLYANVQNNNNIA
jgi:subtilisin family serine protease